MRNIHRASSEASCTVTMSCGMALVRNWVSADDGDCIWPSAQNSVFLRDTLDEDVLPLVLRVDEIDVEDDEAAAVALLLVDVDPLAALSSSIGR